MTELPPEPFLPFSGLDSRILGLGHGHHGVMPVHPSYLNDVHGANHASYANYANYASYYGNSNLAASPSSPLPPPYPPHQYPQPQPQPQPQPHLHQPGSAASGSFYSPPSTLPPPIADLYSHSPPSYFGRPVSSSHHLLDASAGIPHRSSSLSPTTIGRSGPPPGASYVNRPQSPSLSADLPGPSLSRSVSADAAAPQRSPAQLVQRLAQQNSLIRDAWEAERNYLEANRRRAEEVYQEERAIMEDVREGWEHERSVMHQEIQTLKERIQRLEGENATLKAVAAQSVQLSGVVSPLANQRAAGLGSERLSASAPAGFGAHRVSANPSQQHNGPFADADCLPPGLHGASRRPHFASPGSSRMSPNLQPETSPFIPLDPRIQPQNSSKDFLSSPSEESGTPIPVIDVQEIDPKLEGIPIKATAVQRSTFAEVSNKSSPATSPPVDAKPRPEKRTLGPLGPLGPIKRLSSKDHTIQVLAVEESRRRTMHAGHTPNHSLSLFPGLSAVGGTAAAQSERTTPTATTSSVYTEQEEEAAPIDKGKGLAVDDVDESVEQPPEDLFVEPEAILEPTDDVALKGPLMIRNIPAQDEIFWEQVDKKLETLSLGQNGLPTVMQGCAQEGESSAGLSAIDALAQHQPLATAPIGGDASHDPEDEGDEAEAGGKSAEGDLPLKLRNTTNFGAPFGVM